MCIFCFRDLGAQIDGFIAVVAHTLIVGASQVCYKLLVLTVGVIFKM